MSDGLIQVYLYQEIDKHSSLKWGRWEKKIESLGVLLIDWLMTLMIIKDEVFCEGVHMCVELGVCEYVVWDDDLMIFFLIFMASEFFILFGFFLSKSLSEVKHVTRKHCALNIFSGRSGGRWSVEPSVGRSGGQRERGQRWMLFFSLPVLFVEETFLQRETRLTYSLQHIRLSHTAGPHLCKISKFSVVNSSFFSSFSLDLDGGKTVGRAGTEFVLFMFLDELVYSIFSAGLAWGIMAKTFPEISSNWALTLSKTGSIWALFKIYTLGMVKRPTQEMRTKVMALNQLPM